MITIISSTNRPNSNTLKVALYYQKLLNELGATNQIIDLAKLPEDFPFTALYHHQGKHVVFNDFIRRINDSEKFVFIVPEYNGSFPGVLKAFLDGLEYPRGVRNKKCGLIGISSGVMGGVLALSHLTDILNYLGVHVMASKPRIANLSKNFNGEEILDPIIKSLVEDHAKMIVTF
jgi:chromate reductase